MAWWMFALAGLKAAAQMKQAQLQLRAQQEAARSQIIANVEMQKHLQERANEAIEQGQHSISLRRLQGAQYVGRQEAEIGASGTGGASAENLLVGSELGIEMETLQMQKAARDEASALRFESDQIGRESGNIYAQARAATDAYDSQIAGIVLGAAAEIGTMAAAGSSSVPASTAPIDTTTSSLRGGFRSTAPYTGYTGHAGMVGEY